MCILKTPHKHVSWCYGLRNQVCFLSWDMWAELLRGSFHLLTSCFFVYQFKKTSERNADIDNIIFRERGEDTDTESSFVFTLAYEFIVFKTTHGHTKTDLASFIVYTQAHTKFKYKCSDTRKDAHTHRKLCRQVVWVRGKLLLCDFLNNTGTEAGHRTGSGEGRLQKKRHLTSNPQQYTQTHWHTCVLR